MSPPDLSPSKKIDQQMRTVRREVKKGTSPETWRDPPRAAQSQRYQDSECQAVRETVMQILRSSVEEDWEKIEIRQICDQYQHAKLRKPLAPLCGEPSLQPRCQYQEGPEPGKTVRYWRGHVTKSVNVSAWRASVPPFACEWTLAPPKACRKCARSSRKYGASRSWPKLWLARWLPTPLRVFDHSEE